MNAERKWITFKKMSVLLDNNRTQGTQGSGRSGSVGYPDV